MKMSHWFPLCALAAFGGGALLQAQTATWAESTPPSSPALAHHDMTYDSLRHRLIVAGRSAPWASDFVAWAGAADGTWTQLPAPTPPPPGHDLEVAYDSHRDVVVLYTDATNKVWELTGTNWAVVTAASAPIQCKDGALLHYDPIRQRTVLVASKEYPGNNAPSETWLWDGTNWTLAANTNASPRCAAGGGLVFDSARAEMLLLTMHRMETWAFDGIVWTQRHPAHSPSTNLMLFDLAYDPVRQVAVFFGGERTLSPYDHARDTWAWDGTDWRPLATDTVPPFNIDYAFAWFPERDALVMHGGWCEPDWDIRSNVWLLQLRSAPTCLPPPAGLVSWWPGENQANDLAGGNPGTPQNGAGFAPGKVGTAFSLDGFDDQVEIPASPSLDLTNALTVAAWIRPASGSVSGTILSKYDTATGQASWALLLLSGGLLRFTVVQDGGATSPFFALDSTQQVVRAEAFYHLAATFDASVQRMVLYVNGAEVPAAAPPGSANVSRVFASSAPVRIGAMKTLGGALTDFFTGLIDEVVVFNRALASNEIAALYAADSAGLCPPGPEIRLTGPRLLGDQLSLTSTGRVRAGASQILQAATNLALAMQWSDLLTNPAPTPTNLWTVPRPSGTRFFRLLERP